MIFSTYNIKNYLTTDDANKANIKISIYINKIKCYFRSNATITRTPIKDDKDKIKDINIKTINKEEKYLILEANLTIIDNNYNNKEVFDKSKIVFYKDVEEDEYGMSDYFVDTTNFDDDLIGNEESINDFNINESTLYADSKIINKLLYERYKSKINNSIYNAIIDIIKKHIK